MLSIGNERRHARYWKQWRKELAMLQMKAFHSHLVGLNAADVKSVIAFAI